MYIINYFLLASNPFLDSYIHSDFLGKLIFIGLVSLSIISWIVLLHKFWMTRQAHKYSLQFHQAFLLQKQNPLSLECESMHSKMKSTPFLELYRVLKKNSLEILNKNRLFGQKEKETTASLSPADIDYIHARLMTTIALKVKDLDKNLYILSTIVTLAPFLGLLGTVWGILTTFSELQSQGVGPSHDMVLGGLSLALATTVLGLIDAIPALIGYNYLKNRIRDYETEMEGFSSEILASIELQYRQVDIT